MELSTAPRSTSAAPHTLLLLLLLFLLFPLLTLYPSSTRLTESASQFYIHFFDFFLKKTELLAFASFPFQTLTPLNLPRVPD